MCLHKCVSGRERRVESYVRTCALGVGVWVELRGLCIPLTPHPMCPLPVWLSVDCTRHPSLEQSVRDLQDERDRLQNALEMTSHELSVTKEDLSRVRESHSREMEGVQRSATEEKTRLQHELEACMRDLSALQAKNDQSQAETKRVCYSPVQR